MPKSKLKKKKTKKKSKHMIDNLKIDKLLKFLNNTINTTFKLNKNRNLSEIALNTHHKWDSLSHVKLLNALEKKFKISIDERNINQFSNLELIFNYLNKKKLI